MIRRWIYSFLLLLFLIFWLSVSAFSHAFLSFHGVFDPIDSNARQGFYIPKYFEKDIKTTNGHTSFSYKGENINILFKSNSVNYQIFQSKSQTTLDGYNLRDFSGQNIIMTFDGSSENSQILPQGKVFSTTNKFLGRDSTAWETNIENYTALNYSNIYPGINFVFSAENKKIKYDIRVAPEGNLEKIKLRYEGIDRLKIDSDGRLLLIFSEDTISENIPESYQIINGEKIKVSCQYILYDSCCAGFRINSWYDHKAEIIIDPQLIYSTFIGGSQDDYNYIGDVKRDNAGNIYTCGQTVSTNFPMTPGAFDITTNGNWDGVIYKFDKSCTNLLYSTYIGGSDWDAAEALALDPTTGNLYVVGISQSANFPTTPGAYQTSWGGGSTFDVVVFELNNTGSALVFSTYIGSQYDDQGSGIAIDSLGYVYVTGQTMLDFPVTSGAYQSIPGGGWDAFATKLTPDGSGLVFSTYLGGSAYDRGGGIAVDANLNVYLHGMTAGGFPVTAGSVQTTYGGGTNDAFIAKLDPTGTNLLYSTYLGGPGDDRERAPLVVDASGNTYLTGVCQNGFHTTPGAYDVTFNGGTYDAYVTKINPTGNILIFSTYLGGSDNDCGYKLTINQSKEIYVTGEAGPNFPVTSCTYDDTYNGGNTDAFVSKLNPTGNTLLYSTYIGGSNDDRGNGILCYNDTIFIAGNTGSSNFPTTTGCYDNTYNGGGSDMFLLKLLPSNSNILPGNDTNICMGNSVTLTTSPADSYLWSTGSANSSITVSPSATTSYSVTITIGSCTLVDYISVIVNPPINVTLGNDTSACSGQTINLSTGNTYDTYLWQNGSNLPDLQVTLSGYYTVTVTGPGGCSATDGINVDFSPNSLALDLGNDTAICSGLTLPLNAENPGCNYLWQDGSTASGYTATDAGVYSVTVSDSNHCTVTDSIIISEIFPPAVDLGSALDLCRVTSLTLHAGVFGNQSTYLWQDGSTDENFTVYEEGSFSVTVSNQCGSGNDSVYVAACPECNVGLPSAFSPNGDGINDVFRVVGDGYRSIHLVIYNRLGEEVFSSYDNSGWNGEFKGKVQNNEVYFYLLETECLNGEMQRIKGDVTLIR